MFIQLANGFLVNTAHANCIYVDKKEIKIISNGRTDKIGYDSLEDANNNLLAFANALENGDRLFRINKELQPKQNIKNVVPPPRLVIRGN